MSHLSSVKTCLTELNILEYSLIALDIKWYRESWASISLPQKEGPDFGFVWNGDEYELMGDFSQWKQPWSIAVFIEKIQYQYVLKTIKMELQAKGFVNQETKNTNFEQITSINTTIDPVNNLNKNDHLGTVTSYPTIVCSLWDT
tara:strand:- start:113 stop:544 length:432 start_codon:yes stop_codon:yes gene_type:complete